MASVSASRTNWLLFENTAPSDRTSLSRTRSLIAPRGRSLAGRCRHPEDRVQFRKLFTHLDGPVPVTMRRRFGCHWQAWGRALRVCSDPLFERDRPMLLNEAWNCNSLGEAFPEFSAIGVRALEVGLVNRIAFELRGATASEAPVHICQVGLARVSNRSVGTINATESDEVGLWASQTMLPAAASQLHACDRRPDAAMPALLGSILCTSAGDVVSSRTGTLTLSGATEQRGLRQRDPNWISGSPTWHLGSKPMTVFLEVDLRHGYVALSVGDWSNEPVTMAAPGLLTGLDDASWFPCVSLTMVGQEARILNFTVCTET
eukprot:NODE_10209_length_1369_cov_3.191626.p1 GENE.NODE_10209_length_1369_cov_3.191626~~NODE_10209_length_1369_cov_3.191626.p1  ORF type:complete len:318 (-),score=34.34 NODE_10209_length_1369_cov_3.191626:180-1133(-)